MTIPSGESSHKPDESGWSISITQSLRLFFAMSCPFLALASFDRPGLFPAISMPTLATLSSHSGKWLVLSSHDIFDEAFPSRQCLLKREDAQEEQCFRSSNADRSFEKILVSVLQTAGSGVVLLVFSVAFFEDCCEGP